MAPRPRHRASPPARGKLTAARRQPGTDGQQPRGIFPPAPSIQPRATYLRSCNRIPTSKGNPMFKGLATAMLIVTAMLTALPFGVMALIE